MIRGSIVALVTPFNVSGGVDYGALENLIEFHVTEGTHAIVAVGTTGESATLSHSEDNEVIKATVEYVSMVEYRLSQARDPTQPPKRAS